MRNSASSGCSWSRMGGGLRSPASSGRRRRKASRWRSRRRSGRPSAGRRGPCSTSVDPSENGWAARLPRPRWSGQTMEASMLSPDRVPNVEPLSRDAADYEIVRRAIAFVSERWRAQPEIEAIAAAAGVSAGDLHHLFRRWAGLTPKAFVAALTLDHARRLLRDSASVLDASYEVGLSGPGRLHDLFVTHEAMSPGEWKVGGEGLSIAYGFHASPFGNALVMATPRGLAGLAFADPGAEAATLSDMQSRGPKALYVEAAAAPAPLARRIFDAEQW